MLRTLSLLVFVPLLALAAGCIMPDQVSDLQKDVTEVQRQLQTIQQDQQETKEKIDEIETRLEEGGEGISRMEFADVKFQLEDISRSVAILDERLNDSGQRMDHMSRTMEEVRELTRRRPVAVVPGAGGPDPEDPTAAAPVTGGATDAMPSPEELYNAAYVDYSRGNFGLAISGFEEYASRFPDSDTADNALYWVGECHFSQGDFDRAVQAFDRLLDGYPQSDRAPAADLKKGLAYLEQNQVSAAIVQLNHVVSSYPSSDESRIARDKLVSLGRRPG
jgi:tol-pal system protein YbgF